MKIIQLRHKTYLISQLIIGQTTVRQERNFQTENLHEWLPSLVGNLSRQIPSQAIYYQRVLRDGSDARLNTLTMCAHLSGSSFQKHSTDIDSWQALSCSGLGEASFKHLPEPLFPRILAKCPNSQTAFFQHKISFAAQEAFQWP